MFRIFCVGILAIFSLSALADDSVKQLFKKVVKKNAGLTRKAKAAKKAKKAKKARKKSA